MNYKLNIVYFLIGILPLAIFIFFLLPTTSQDKKKEYAVDAAKLDPILIQILERAPHWEQCIIDIAKAEAELTEDITQMLAQALLNSAQAKDLAKTAMGPSQQHIKNLRYTQTKFKITLARASLTRAASAALRQKVDESIFQAILDLGKDIDDVLSVMQNLGDIS